MVAATANSSGERCEFCQAFTLYSLAGGNEYRHQPTLSALKDSAFNGCDFCALLWHCFSETVSSDALAAAMKGSDQQIIIRPNRLNMKLAPALDGHSAFDELWVEVGEYEENRTWVTVELFTLRRK